VKTYLTSAGESLSSSRCHWLDLVDDLEPVDDLDLELLDDLDLVDDLEPVD